MIDRPVRLSRSHDRTTFDCGNGELNTWLHRYAWQNQKARNAVTYVACEKGQVLGYYSLASSLIDNSDAPPTLRKNRPRSIPTILLARLAVDTSAQGRGLGMGLLADAITRSLSLSHHLGIAAMVVDCIDHDAKAFYFHHAEFEELPSDPLRLVLSLSRVTAP